METDVAKTSILGVDSAVPPYATTPITKVVPSIEHYHPSGAGMAITDESDHANGHVELPSIADGPCKATAEGDDLKIGKMTSECPPGDLAIGVVVDLLSEEASAVPEGLRQDSDIGPVRRSSTRNRHAPAMFSPLATEGTKRKSSNVSGEETLETTGVTASKKAKKEKGAAKSEANEDEPIETNLIKPEVRNCSN